MVTKSAREDDTEDSDGAVRAPIVRDMVDVSQRELQECVHVWRRCVYVHQASQRLNRVTLAGSLEIFLGGIFPVASFYRAAADRVLKNLERAMQWIDVAGMVPFSVDHTDVAVQASESGRGGEIGLRSDDPEATRKSDRPRDEERPTSYTRLYTKRPGNGSGYTLIEEIGDGTDNQDDQPPPKFRETVDKRDPVDATDFDFTVPSLGVGHFSVYRDARDNIRKAIYHSPEENAHRDEDMRDKIPQRNWYVFTVDTPGLDGSLTSILSRLLPAYKEMQELERLEKSGARLGFNPQLVTEEHPPGKNQHQLDRHRAFNTDHDNMIELGNKSRQGVDAFYEKAIDRNQRFHRDLLNSLNIDYDTTVQRFVQQRDAPGETPANQEKITRGSKLSTVLVPHKVLDMPARHNGYIGKVAIEYGIAHSDFAAGTMRFKLDQGTVNARLIERARSRRTILCGLLYDVFKVKNGGRLQDHLHGMLDDYTQKSNVVNEAKEKLQELIEKSSDAALHHIPEGIPGQYMSPEPTAVPEVADSTGQPPAKRPRLASPSAGGDGGSGGGGTAGIQSTGPDIVTPLEVLPKPMQDMLSWYEQLKLSFEHLAEMRRVLSDLVDSPQPVHVHWTQPVVGDREELIQAAEHLQYSDTKKNAIWRQYYAV